MSRRNVKNAAPCDGVTAEHSHCSDDGAQIWHGYDTPAIACGFHASFFSADVFKGHAIRLGATENDSVSQS